MADDTDLAPQSPMAEFAGLPWHDDVQPWAEEVSTRLNNYDQGKAIAAANDRAGATLVAGVDTFRKGLLDRTAADPHFAGTALDLVQPTIATLVNAHPSIPDDERQTHHDAIVADLNNQIASTAVKSMAERNGHAAADMLNSPRIAAALSDTDRSELSSYITLQEVARNADGTAARIQGEQQRRDTWTAATINHATNLYDPQADTPVFTPGWAQRVMADRAVQPDEKAALMHLYGRLQTTGDAGTSDPITVQRALAGDMNHIDVLNEAGHSLKLVDALGLASLSLPLSNADRARYGQAGDVIQQARSALYGPNGENGAAGHAAWGRFVNWMLPTLRMGGAALDNPDAHPLNWLHRFTPTGDDIVPPTPPEQRRPLKEIFG